MPHSAAGPRIEPPVSEPSAPGTNPAATAAPAPLDDDLGAEAGGDDEDPETMRPARPTSP